jgi:hypothetical protein
VIQLMNRKSEQVTLFVDGSRDGTQEPITHIVAVTTNEWVPFFIKEINHGTETHSSENILRHITTCEEYLKTQQIRVSGIVSDNEEKMKKVRLDFYNTHAHNSLHVVASPGDTPHALQLVIGDFLQWESNLFSFKNVAEKAQYIANKFKNTRYFPYSCNHLFNEGVSNFYLLKYRVKMQM